VCGLRRVSAEKRGGRRTGTETARVGRLGEATRSGGVPGRLGTKVGGRSTETRPWRGRDQVGDELGDGRLR